MSASDPGSPVQPPGPVFDQQHEWYKRRSEAWRYNREHHEGGRALITSAHISEYLIQFKSETGGYTDRVKRAPGLYENLPKRALQVYQSQLFRVQPRRTLPKKLTELEMNVDLQGTEADEFFKAVSEEAQLLGQTYVLIDSPHVPEALDVQDELGNVTGQRPMTEQDRMDLNLRPWFEHLPTENLIDWSVELDDPSRRGELNYAVIRDELWVHTEPFVQAQKQKRYRVWTREAWQEWRTPIVQAGEMGANPPQGAPELVDQGENPLGVVPIVVFYDERKGPMQGLTLIDDIALKSNALWHRASVEDESFHYQGFNQLAVFTEKAPSEIELHQGRAILFGLEDKAMYLSPSDVPTVSFERFADRMVESAGDLVYARTSRQIPTAQVESAEKRTIDRSELEAMLQRKANLLESSEEMCWRIMAAWMQEDWDVVDVIYNRDYVISHEAAIEWQAAITSGVRNRLEWFQSFHPGATDEEALQAIMQNLDLEAVLVGVNQPAMQPDMGGFGAEEEPLPGEGEPAGPAGAPPEGPAGEPPPGEQPEKPEEEEAPEEEEESEDEDGRTKKKKRPPFGKS